MIGEFAGTDQALAGQSRGTAALTAANATIFRDRGLHPTRRSSPTTAFTWASRRSPVRARWRRAARGMAVVGPGLDFTNKADGYDYYPQQTIQPFALINPLRRLNSLPRICR